MKLASISTKAVLSLGLSLALVASGATDTHGLNGIAATVSITAISGYSGHAFVYAQVSDSTFAYPAPTGTGHQSPFFSEWVAEPIASPSCPWIWAVYVFDRATDTQINAPAPNAPSPNFGTTTILCASPTGSPVDQPPQVDAAARLDLDLQVTVSPTTATAGSPSVLSAVLSSTLTEDLNLYLSMAIEDWSVSSWSVDFGDGQTTAFNGPAGTSIRVPHVYQAAGRYDARVVAFISGHAQAAVYDRYGTVHLVRRPFSVEVGNHAIATTRPRPSRSYLPPQAMVGVVPYLGVAIGGPSATAFRHIDGLRGALTTLSVQLLIGREGQLTIDGVRHGFGQSRLTGWRLDGAPSDAPAGSGTAPGVRHRADEPMRLQWNSPDRIVRGQPQDYLVPVTLFVETRFPDGHVGSYVIASSFSVSVNFAAESG
ncbi:MAG TPA: hypothetical protein VGR77_10885 [Candidatus Dormibacteraeota bacterium]|nr:hypothetical protein [Candidatus Dormibacteraeota bacterium]